ncbi:hypothetical protein VR010_03030 [Actinomycetaceae bacterium L2_0104]
MSKSHAESSSPRNRSFLFSGTNGILIALTSLLAVIGIFSYLAGFGQDSIFVPMLMVSGFGIGGAWISLRSLWGSDSRGGDAHTRAKGFVLGCLAAPVAPALAVGASMVVSKFIPTVQAQVAVASHNSSTMFYEMDIEGAAYIFLPALFSYLGGSLISLSLILLVGLPLLAWKKPAMAAEGSKIEKISPKNQNLATRLVFIGLSPLILGIALWTFSDQELSEFPDRLGWLITMLRYGQTPIGSDVAFVLGVILIVIGGIATGVGCLLTLLDRDDMK